MSTEFKLQGERRSPAILALQQALLNSKRNGIDGDLV